MRPGLYGQQLRLMEELRAESFTAHARIQTLPFFQALAACQLPLESYVGQLRALSIIHGVLERALDGCPDERVASVWAPDMRKLPLLLRDLRFFEPRVVADIREAVDAALETAEALRLRAIEQPLSLLGSLYVVEGATLGAQVLRPLYARALVLADGEGLCYLDSYGAAVRSHWARYLQRMDTLRLSEEEHTPLSEAARGLFAHLEMVYQTLYPFRPESRTFLVTAINPEAGRHPVPADARELQAALRAADRCWQRFPYFEQRYGERGRRFARSDAVWLATLYAYTPAQIIRQVRWLGRVLAGRGMPTLLLQDQLEILVEELAAVLPERKSDYEKLALAATDLWEARRRHLTDDQLQTLAQAFEQAVGPEWNVRLPHVGALLVCAVADEREGSDLAVESLQGWMTDAARFPAAWIAAVRHTLTQARTQARPIPEASAQHPNLP